MKQILLISTLLLLSVLIVDTSNLYAQQDYLHQPLKSEGKIPPAFLNTVKENYAINSENRTEADLDDFNVISGYAVKQLLWSGKIVFGDTVTRYLNRVADIVLKDNPTLRQEIQIYTVKSSVVNAFTTSDGFIFVNLGLIANCENEAQLAYILAHEISHYVKQHSVNRYTYRREEQRNAGRFTWKNSNREKVDYTARLNISNYSRTQEIEADDYGLELFSKTAYDQDASVSGFEMLDASDTLEKVTFKKAYFTNQYIQEFDDSLFRERTPPYTTVGRWIGLDVEYESEDEDEKLSTHPNIEARIKNISKRITETTNQNKLYITATKESFQNIKKIADYEILQIQLVQNRCIDAIYQIIALNNKYNENSSTDITMAKALYGIAKHGNVEEKISTNYDYSETDWKDNNWYAALGEMTERDKTIFALTYLFSNLDKKIDTLYSKKAITDLLIDVYIYHDELLKENLRITNNFDSVWTTQMTKHARYDEFLKVAKEEFDEYQEWEDFKENRKGMREYRKRVVKARYNGFKLGVDDVMITDVRYLKMNVKKGKIAPLKTLIDKEEYAIESIKESADRLDLNTLVLDPRALEKSETTLAIFNDLATVNSWYIAQPDIDEMYTFVTSNYTDIEEVAERNGTRHFVRMAMLDLKAPFESSKYYLYGGAGFIFTAAAFYMFPYTIYRTFVNHDAIILTEVYDLDRSRPLIMYNVSGKPFGKTNMKQNIFFQLSQIKSK
ncbi:M48 family metallopeptidase [Bernardetia sp. ABR2-2B]|uniref:M48 family metallopeptidase n=1 Tax=Bernardetia sp. ABR2-2B TaxID=3127472 RepID=UPI0030D419C6